MSPRSHGGAGRVIAGTARGIALRAPAAGTRPLGDRVKQTLFAILERELRGRRFLDLFAGSGAGGIEALSRGAAAAIFVERDRDAIAVIEHNLAATHLEDRGWVVRADALGWLEREGHTAGPFAAILVDPPYDRPDELTRALQRIANAGRGAILEPDGVIVAKHFWKSSAPEVPLLRSVRQERFGETMLTFQRWADEEDG